MALINRFKIGASLALAAVITAVVTLMAWIINMVPQLGITIQPLFSIGPIPIDPYTPFTPTVTNTFMGWLAGAIKYIPGGNILNPANLLTVFIPAFLIVLTGFLLFSFLPMFRVSKNATRNEIFNIVIAGTVVWYLILIGFVLPSAGIVGVSGGLALYAAAIAVISPFVADFFRIKI